MGQKNHSVGIRLGVNRTFDGLWYDEPYRNSFKTEQQIRKAISSFFSNFPFVHLGRIFYQKSYQKTLITIFFYCRGPKGRRGQLKRKRELKRKRYFFRYSRKNSRFLCAKDLNTLVSTRSVAGFLQESDLVQKIHNQASLSPGGKSVLKASAAPFGPKSFAEGTPPSDPKGGTSSQAGFCPLYAGRVLKSARFFRAIDRKQHGRVLVLKRRRQRSRGFSGSRNFKRMRKESRSLDPERQKMTMTFKQCFLSATYLLVSRRACRFRSPGKLKKKLETIFCKDNLQKTELREKIKNKKPKPPKNKGKRPYTIFTYLERSLSLLVRENVYVHPVRCRKLSHSAIFFAQEIASIFQQAKKKRVPYHAIKKLLRNLPGECLGIRILCSGRLGGVKMAKKFAIKKGQTSLNMFSQKVDFAQATALTKYGIIGVKVWISFKSKKKG